MTDTRPGEKLRHCSFCGKSQREVKKLIEGQNKVCICDECIALCNDIIQDEHPIKPEIQG